MKGLGTIAMLMVSNVFMTFAWYGNLKIKEMNGGRDPFPLIIIILLSWGVAFFEYCLTVPANRMGFVGNGGPFTLFQLKIIQECISLVVFTVLALLLFKTETFRWNYLVSFFCIILAVYFAFKK
ncbi:MAG: DMT family protein [Tidjanibacter sp.]|nr:DMT family protein [Tidjanibacter sp.]